MSATEIALEHADTRPDGGEVGDFKKMLTRFDDSPQSDVGVDDASTDRRPEHESADAPRRIAEKRIESFVRESEASPFQAADQLGVSLLLERGFGLEQSLTGDGSFRFA